MSSVEIVPLDGDRWWRTKGGATLFDVVFVFVCVFVCVCVCVCVVCCVYMLCCAVLLCDLCCVVQMRVSRLSVTTRALLL